MLPRNARLTAPSDFARTTKSGFRATSDNFVGYLYISAAERNQPRAGLIVGKSAGNSVQRHRISRQIRHAIAPTLNTFPENSLIVIRALNGAAEADVHSEISALLAKLHRKLAKIAQQAEAQA